MLKQGEQCTIQENTYEYKLLSDLADVLTDYSPRNQKYAVKEIYLCKDKEIKWTTVVNVDENYTAIDFNTWKDLIDAKNIDVLTVAAKLSLDKNFPDKKE